MAEVKEPKGLDMSLDDIIKQHRTDKPEQNKKQFGKGRGAGIRGSSLRARGGIVKQFQQARPVYHEGDAGNRQFRRNMPMPGHGAGRMERGNYQGGFRSQRGGRGGYNRPDHQFRQQQTNNGYTPYNQRPSFRQVPQEYGRGNSAAFRGARAAAPVLRQAAPQQGFEQPPQQPHLECFCRDATGEVVVKFKNIEIVRVAANGDVTLSAGGWYSLTLLQGMNDVLQLIGMKVSATGESGDWRVSDGRTLLRFSDGMRLPGKGATGRAQTVLQAFKNPEVKTAALAATAASTAAAIAAGIIPAASVGSFGRAGPGPSSGTRLDGFKQVQFGSGRAPQGQLGRQGFAGGSVAVDMEEDIMYNYGNQGNFGREPDAVRRLKAQGRYVGNDAPDWH